MNQHRIFISLSILFLNVLYISANQYGSISSRYTFNTITVEDGLPLNFIDDVFKDSKGYIWVSTQGGGLSRYDGYEFVQYNVNSYPVALKSNFIRQTSEDAFNRLWVASDYGIDIIDMTTMQKSNIIYDINNNLLAKILDSPTNSLFVGSNGSMWVVTDSKIHCIDFDKKGNVIRLYTLENETYDKLYSYSTLCEINGEVWVGYKGSVYEIHVEDVGKLSLHPIFSTLNIGFERHIFGFLKKENTVWIGTENGLFRYNLLDKSLRQYLHNPNDPFSLSQDMVTDLCMSEDGILIVGTLKGINFYDSLNDSFERVSHTNDIISLNSDFVNCLLSDKNNIWVGTEAGGINKLTLRRLDIKNYIHDPNNKGSIAPNPVNAIHEDSFGNLWIGNVEGGLSLRYKGSSKFMHFYSGNGGLSHNSVSELQEIPGKELWIGTWGGGIDILDLDRLPQISINHLYVNSQYQLDYVAQVRYDVVNNGMWIGTNRNIYFYDLGTHTIHSPLTPQMTANIKGVIGSLIDDKQQLWMGTSAGIIIVDLNSFDKKNFKCYSHFFEPNIPDGNKLFLTNVTSIYQSRDRTIWIGSKGYGLIRLKYENKSYTCLTYTTDQGLPSNTIFGTVEDERGFMWISTGYGISCYNPLAGHFVNYTKNDGLLDLQFYWNACYKSPTTKNMFFGSMSGLLELKDSWQYIKPAQRKVVFTKLQVLNKTVWMNDGNYLKKDISYADCVDIHERDKSFSIEFSALDYDNPSTISYSYRLIGFDDKWIDVPSGRRFASYTNLKPGSYTLQVRCTSSTDKDSENISELRVVIHPFFYKTGWFIGLCIILLAFLCFQVYNWRVSQFKKQREILHCKVEERTLELERQKGLLEEHTAELKLQNTILVTQNVKISNQRKQILDMSKKVQEAMSDKMAFFTNITHEFRTPITLIMGPIERALKLSTNPKVIEQLQFVSRNSRHLLSLVNQLMDFRKVETDNITIAPVNGNFMKFLDNILLPFESFARERNIEIRKIYRMDSPCLLFDEEAMHKIVTNLLSNAIKFTPDNGKISFYVCTYKNNENNSEKLYINVSDSGTGIREEDIKSIFDRFFQSKNNINYPIYGQSGTGIGLYLCKKIVLLLNGSIEARNNKVRGASFRIILPVERERRINQMPDSVIVDKEVGDSGESDNFIEKEDEIGRMTILIAEDNPDMRKYISSILSEYYKIVEAENGLEALEILKNRPIDFIISDLMMPVMDGMELSRKVKDDFSISHIPFLMLTAKTSVEAQIDSYKIGVDEFLQKPFDEQLLLTRIKNIIDRRRLYQRKFSLYMTTEELNIAEESQDEKFLKRALRIVKDNYKNTNYEVSNFVEDLGISKSLVNKKMQMLTGQSAGQFIRTYRLNLAHELIVMNHRNMNISEIAYEVGFNDPKYFTRCFTKHFGLAPSGLSRNDK